MAGFTVWILVGGVVAGLAADVTLRCRAGTSTLLGLAELAELAAELTPGLRLVIECAERDVDGLVFVDLALDLASGGRAASTAFPACILWALLYRLELLGLGEYSVVR